MKQFPWNKEPMHCLIVDEAGTSANERVSVVAGIIPTLDQRMIAEHLLNKVLDMAVPKKLRAGFVFHAMTIMGDRSLREHWPFADRLQLVREVMSIPRLLGLPICLGIHRRNDPMDYTGWEPNLTKEVIHHAFAFSDCLQAADRYMWRHFEDGDHRAQVMAEDHPSVKRHLQLALKADRMFPHSAEDAEIRLTGEERESGMLKQTRYRGVARIDGQVIFVAKNMVGSLQLADALAYGFKRFFGEYPHGEEDVKAILDEVPDDEGWAAPGSNGLWTFRKRKNGGPLREMPSDFVPSDRIDGT